VARYNISVIIPTYRRKKYLLDVLECLEKQTISPLETFIIDSSPIRDQLNRKEISQLPFWVNYETCENKKNISWQRNLVIPRCLGEIILFLDDDILFEESLIEDHLESYTETRADGISGLVLLSGEEMSQNPIPNNLGVLDRVQAPNVRNLNHIIETKVICTANFSIKRELLLAVRGFDEQIRGTWDDTELGYRLFDAGYKIIHHPKPSVLHLKPYSGGTREDGLDLEFVIANILYFHLKHSQDRSFIVLSLAAIWKYCRPGRRWLRVRFMIKRCISIIKAIYIARKKNRKGPKYLIVKDLNN
jgi:GT2 family glycosyltransferase